MQASVIIPTYNRSDVILRSLETWTQQTLAPTEFEVIVVDNHSTDGADKLIKDFVQDKPHFRYLLETRKGSTNARHAGAGVAKSDIFIFCDDDGLFHPDSIKAILDVYQQNPAVMAVAGKIKIEWDREAPDWIEPYLFMLGKLDYGNEVIYGNDIYLNGGLLSIRKQVFEELGGFNPDLIGDYLVGDGDTGLVIKLHKAGKLIGWTPYAEMKHLQFVDKQGSVKDIGRRFYNTGVSNTYGFFRKQHFSFSADILIYILRSLILFLKKSIEYAVVKDKKYYFSKMQRKGELVFWYNLRIRSIREEVRKADCYIPVQ
jgi:glucosyl-dolichyl phosphate glucuronosyltransferase